MMGFYFRQLEDPAHIRFLWEEIEKHRLAPVVFYDDQIRDRHTFCDFMMDRCHLFAVLRREGVTGADEDYENLIAFAYLNGWAGKAVCVHFGVFPWAWGVEAREAGVAFVDWLLHVPRLEGGQQYDALVGLIPASNGLAVRFAKNIGFEEKTVIPSAALVHGVINDLQVLVATRETIKKEDD